MFVCGEDCALTTADKTAGIRIYLFGQYCASKIYYEKLN